MHTARWKLAKHTNLHRLQSGNHDRSQGGQVLSDSVVQLCTRDPPVRIHVCCACLEGTLLRPRACGRPVKCHLEMEPNPGLSWARCLFSGCQGGLETDTAAHHGRHEGAARGQSDTRAAGLSQATIVQSATRQSATCPKFAPPRAAHSSSPESPDRAACVGVPHTVRLRSSACAAAGWPPWHTLQDLSTSNDAANSKVTVLQ